MKPTRRIDAGKEQATRTDAGKAENLVDHRHRILSPFSFLGTYQWMCGLVGMDVVKISGYSVKPGWNGHVGGVQHVHVYIRKWCREINREHLPRIVTSLSLGYKRKGGASFEGHPFCVRRVHP